MKKFAANYVVSESGKLLKNGIVLAGDDGIVNELIDTKGDLEEMAGLVFLNGILIPNYLYFRKIEPQIESSPEDSPKKFIHQLINESNMLLANTNTNEDNLQQHVSSAVYTGEAIWQLKNKLSSDGIPFDTNKVLDTAIRVQGQFSDLTISEILQTVGLYLDKYFLKEKAPGLFLLIGSDLIQLHLTDRSRLKKIL